MAIFRKVHIHFWSDIFIQNLTPEQKFFFLYLLTNEKTKQCGIYEITKRHISFDTGYNIETVDKLISFFINAQKIYFSPETNEIAIKNWQKYNGSRSPDVQNLVNKELISVKNPFLIEWMQSDTTVVPESKKFVREEPEPEPEEEPEEEPETSGENKFSGDDKNSIVGVKKSKKKIGTSAEKKKVKKQNPDSEPYWHDIRKKWIWFNKTHLKFNVEPIPSRDYSHMHRIIEKLRERAVGQAVVWTQENALMRWEKFLTTAFTKHDWLPKNFELGNLESKMQTVFNLIDNPNGQGKISKSTTSSVGRTIELDRP